MNLIDKIVTNLLGAYTFDFYVVYFLFVVVGVFLSLSVAVLFRNKNSVDTPYKFSSKFLWKDNKHRVIASVLTVFLSVRFAPELYRGEPTYFTGFLLGGCLDQAIYWLGQIQRSGRAKFKPNDR